MPSAATATPEVERLLVAVIKTLYARDTEVQGLNDLPLAQLRVLNVLARGGEEWTPTMGNLAEALGVAVSTTTQIVERIEKRGFVRRDHSDPEDRRVVRLALTEAGRRLLSERRHFRHLRLERVMAQLSAEQSDAVLLALAPLAAAARQIDQDDAQDASVLLRSAGVS